MGFAYLGLIVYLAVRVIRYKFGKFTLGLHIRKGNPTALANVVGIHAESTIDKREGPELRYILLLAKERRTDRLVGVVDRYSTIE